MNEKTLKIIFVLIGAILLVLSIIMLYFYIQNYGPKDPLGIERNTKLYAQP